MNEKRIPDEGFINVEGGNVWYKIVGADKKKTPILLLHGGPGASSHYLAPLEKLASDRPVIFYDQLGGGRSDRPDDRSLWKISRFVRELQTLRDELGLDKIHLFGHSAGTMLAAEYLATNPTGIETIIFAGPVISTKKYLEDCNKLKLQLPSPIRDTLLLHEKNGTIQSKAYQDAYSEYLKTHWCRVYPYPKELGEILNNLNMQVYETMWGNNEFFSTGNLKDFDRTSILKDIKVPTLFTCGRFDLNTPETTKWFAEQVKKAEFVVFEKSAHTTMNEEPEAYVEVIKQFLDKNE